MPATKTSIDAVKELFDAWTAADLDRIANCFTDDAVYHNIPMEAIQGKDQIRKTIGAWLESIPGMTFEFRNIISEGDVVMMERRDFIPRGDGQHELPVMGIVELREGKIAAWREYFDLSQMSG